MVCGACGSASENETWCPGCGSDLGAQADRRQSGSPSQDALPVVDAAAPKCPRHPAMGAGATCRRCGRFVCSRCSEDALRREVLTCPECLLVEKRLAVPARLSSYGSQLIASWVAVALTLVALGAGLVFFMEQPETTRRGVLLLVGPALALLLLSTALFAATRRLVFGWAATVMESLMLVPLWVTSPSWCTAVLAAAPVFAAVRLLQMKELRAST
ncbi:MAG: hypothetical protein IAE78_00495 [Myxococcus sp.]|nr:hypothetical protein [Myxococcus sp.]